MRNNGLSHTFLLFLSKIINNKISCRSVLLITIQYVDKKNKFLNRFVLFLYIFYMNKAPPDFSF